jgi:uncharacterized UBP type Zn finger protein
LNFKSIKLLNYLAKFHRTTICNILKLLFRAKLFILLDSSDFVPNQEALEMVMSMGFTKEQSTKALKATNNNLERAADWVYSHIAELDSLEMEVDSQPAKPSFRDGNDRKFKNSIILFLLA